MPFRPRSWIEILEDFEGRLDLRHMSAIVESVLASSRADDLAAITSLYDLIVVPRPVPDPPFGVVVVRSPVSMRPPSPGLVRIEHLSVTGHDDVIERAAAEAVPLFWRFMIEKFGVHPA